MVSGVSTGWTETVRNRLTMPTDGEQLSANEGAKDRITQLKPTAQLDFDTTNLADTWIRWKQELEL